VPFRVYRFIDFEVFWSSTVSVYRSRTGGDIKQLEWDYLGHKVSVGDYLSHSSSSLLLEHFGSHLNKGILKRSYLV